MKKLISIFAAVFRASEFIASENLKPNGLKTIERPEEMDFQQWRTFIGKQVVETQFRNSKEAFEFGSREDFLRKLTVTIIESNIVW